MSLKDKIEVLKNGVPLQDLDENCVCNIFQKNVYQYTEYNVY